MLFIKLRFYPEWEDIFLIRNFIIAFLSQKIADKKEAYRIAIIASELMENACKYSATGEAVIELEQKTDNKIEFSIKNITKKENIEEFKKILNMINKGPAKETYKNMMLRAINADNNKVKQLGLARVRYEGHSEITYETRDDIHALLENTKNTKMNNDLMVLNIKIKTFIIPGQKGEVNGN
ncbi:MAG: hypothetical protein JXB88_25850 [Spirochaetales bacterium]|nr:hypothetical protein [Spirochaetales bacterium]